ncbi:hypothetical protein [Flavobacterium sp. TBRC 19031]|uniref:hypothetical protein n=1 Tax=Flavobacterium mekongense TaxID=3379707 RepID=UPI0039998900
MRNAFKIVLIIICSFFILMGCSKENSQQPNTGVIQTDLIAIEDALDYPNTNFVSLVNKRQEVV